MAVKGFLFSSDIAMFIAVLTVSTALISHFITTTVDTISNQSRVYQIKTSAEHAINVLLFTAKEEFRCMYGKNKIPVPACVWANGDVDTNWFWVDGRFKCYVNTTNRAASSTVKKYLGCEDKPPKQPNTLVVIPFEFCWAGDVRGKRIKDKQNAIKNCKWVEANLVVWPREDKS